jgi:hypothetical protein
MKRLYTFLASFFFLVFVNGNFAYSQDGRQGSPFGGPGAAKFEQFKKMRIIEALHLDDETAIRFVTKYNKFTEEMRDAGKKRNEVIARLDDALKNKASEETLDKIIKEFLVCDDRAGDIRNKFYQDLREVFSMKQLAQFIVFEKNFNQNIREIMREMTQERERERREP